MIPNLADLINDWLSDDFRTPYGTFYIIPTNKMYSIKEGHLAWIEFTPKGADSLKIIFGLIREHDVILYHNYLSRPPQYVESIDPSFFDHLNRKFDVFARNNRIEKLLQKDRLAHHIRRGYVNINV